ncbi:hypothetical protein CPC08DRAFT_771639 [Agrocybe pediades]|nr:hypothetical protein CPC08DRAFT_771639 [Agrocybe pediades]
MQRHIFRYLSLEVEHDAYDSDDQMELFNRCDIRQRETIQRLIGIVSAGLAPRVRTFTVLGASHLDHFSQPWVDKEHGLDMNWGDHKELTRAQFKAAVIPVFFATLGHYTGLQTLSLESITLDLSTHAAFASLHNLIDLQMDDIILLEPFTPSIQFRLETLTLSRIMYPHELHRIDPLPANFCTPQSLNSLYLGKLSDQVVTSLAVIKSLVKDGGEFTSLTILEVAIRKADMQMFLPLLSQCSSLTDLMVNITPREGDFLRQEEPMADWREDILPDISADTCPQLKYFAGPFNVAEKIVPGRPISHLSILDDGLAGTRRTLESMEQLLRSWNGEDMEIFRYKGCQTRQNALLCVRAF